MLLRIRADQASDADVKLSTYFLGWLNQTATDECLIEQTIPKDGQWYNLVLDTSKMGLKGIIHALELRLAGADGSKTANVAVEIESMAFTKTLEEAQNYVFGRNEVEEPAPDDGKQDNTPDAEATEPQEDGDEKEEKKGCGSSIAAGTALLGIVGTGTVVLSRKKNPHNRKERKK